MKTSSLRSPETHTFGLFGLFKSKRVVLPLKGVECDFAVVAGLVEVSITQIFRQENPKPLDCQYLFPMPADASVFFCEADINGRTIRAQVREKEEARQLVAEKKAAGFRTALVEAERENLFTLSLGNIQSGDLVVVQLKYFQTLRFMDGKPSVEIPTCPGIRYIPGKPLLRSNKGKGIIDDTDEVPDASKITPVRIDAEHPDAAYIEVRGTLESKFVNQKEVVSPSHAIELHPTGEQLRVSLSNKGEVPDRDFVLRWTEQEVGSVTSRAWLQSKANEEFALLEVRAPRTASSERIPVDFYFLVDRSGSMEGSKWEQAARALLSCTKVLGPNDRAMVTFFESTFQDFAERPLSARELLADERFQQIRQLGIAGGTELRPALQHVLEMAAQHSKNHARNLILITDAQIGNEEAILSLMKQMPNFPVHCFGIDVALNDAMLLALARQQGGTFHSLNPNENIEQAVTSLGKTLGQPVLLNLELSAGWEIADARIPNLYAGQVHYLSARSTQGTPLELKAQSPMGDTVKIQFEAQTANVETPYLHWCRSRIQRLVAEGRRSDAIALSVQSSVICPLTAFVAWDESEKVPVATHDLVQPNLMVAETGPVLQTRMVRLAGMRETPAVPQRIAACYLDRSEPLDAEPDFAKFIEAPAEQVLNEAGLKRGLSNICHTAGLTNWEPLVKAILDWIAQAKGAERTKRIEQVNVLYQEIVSNARATLFAKALGHAKEAQEAKEKAEHLLRCFIKA